MGYVKPQFLVLEDYAEGIFLASGSGCAYGAATVTFNESSQGNWYSITVRAAHEGETDDSRGQKLVLNFSVPVSDLSCDIASVRGADSGTQVILTSQESHSAEFCAEIRFRAESRPNISAMVTSAD